MSSQTKGKKNILKTPGQQLRRGKACLNCRYLKIKCDGVKPVCGPCVRVPKDDECEYTDGPSRTQELQDNIARLQVRIRQLESHTALPEKAGLQLRPSPTSSHVSGSPVSSSCASGDELYFVDPEPPAFITNTLLDAFIPHATHFGFFLHLERFRRAALLPFGDLSRPSQALLCAVYLWGVHLCPSYQAHEPVVLDHALRQLAMEVSCNADRNRVIQTIQAQVLLAMYFFRNNYFVEVEFHTTGAVSLTLSHNLHKFRCAKNGDSSLLGVAGRRDVHPTPPSDAIEQGECINGFWTVFCLERMMRLAFRQACSSFGFLESPFDEIDTPWPLDMADCSKGSISNIASSSTIRHFIHSTSRLPIQSSESTMYAQATIIFHQASFVYGSWHLGMPSDEFNSLMIQCAALGHLISRLQHALPHVLSVEPSAVRRTLLVTHALTTCASLRLQTIYAACGDIDASDRAISSAKWILESFGDISVPDFNILHPIVGTLCLVACQTLIDELRRIEALNDSSVHEQLNILRAIMAGMTNMSILGVDCPFISFQLAQVQIVYNRARNIGL